MKFKHSAEQNQQKSLIQKSAVFGRGQRLHIHYVQYNHAWEQPAMDDRLNVPLSGVCLICRDV